MKIKKENILCHLPNAPDASYYAPGLLLRYIHLHYWMLGSAGRGNGLISQDL